MSIVLTANFLLFAFATVILYYIIPKKFRWILIGVANILFCFYCSIDLLVYIAVACGIAYGASLILAKYYEAQDKECEGLDRKAKKPIREKYAKKRTVIVSITVILMILGLTVTKYTGFLLDNVNAVFGTDIAVKKITDSIPAIIGCSYFTLCIIAYVTDVHRGKIKAQKNFFKFFTFVAFFPHMIQGPIEKYDYIAPQIFEGNKFKFANIKTGLMLILWGMAKELIIANRLTPAVTYVFSNYKDLSAIAIMIGLVAFSFQLYCEWSAYCDIVAGVAEMMGIEITKNFERPYFSQTMPEYWRRWHISMGAFYREYVLYPVSTSNFCLKLNKNTRKIFGSTAGRIISSSLPILAVWFITGLWHDASWQFAFWGIFQGILIMLSVIFTPIFEKTNKKLNFKTETFGWTLFRIGRTFFLCTIGRIFFKSASLSDAFGMFKGLTRLGGNFAISGFGLDKKDWLVAVVAILVLIAVSAIQEHFKCDVRKKLDEQPIIFKWIILYILIMAIIIFGVYGDATHISSMYENF